MLGINRKINISSSSLLFFLFLFSPSHRETERGREKKERRIFNEIAPILFLFATFTFIPNFSLSPYFSVSSSRFLSFLPETEREKDKKFFLFLKKEEECFSVDECCVDETKGRETIFFLFFLASSYFSLFSCKVTGEEKRQREEKSAIDFINFVSLTFCSSLFLLFFSFFSLSLHISGLKGRG